MRKILVVLVAAFVCLGLAGSWTTAEAQFGKLKDKVKQKASEKATKKAEEVLDKSGEGETEPAETPEGAEEGAEEVGGKAPAATGASEDMTLYTKYDFIPGDRVIFYDDYAGEEMGEFPSRWRLDEGVFEIARQGSRNYILCTDQGRIRPKIQPGPLPPKYTIEVEFYSKGPEQNGHWFHIEWLDAEDRTIGAFAMQDHVNTHLRIINETIAQKDLPAPLSPGIHTMRVMATKTTLKCYIDNERVANVPAVEAFNPVDFRIFMDPWKDEANNPMLLATVRYAEGGKTLRQQLDEAGRIVTHGILFDSGSAKIKAESYKTLAEIGAMLTEDATLRLSIEGHTDSDGADEANLKLSQERADAVRSYLAEVYKVDTKRLETKGFGEAKPIDTNDTPEGKANNRRVELARI